ncbi:MAG: phenylalanine--tRNA ligase subunit alpha, partial [Pseudomonadota bacterium]
MHDLATLSAQCQTWVEAIALCEGAKALDDIRVNAMGKRGVITKALKELGTLSVAERQEHGKTLNHLRDTLNAAILEAKERIANAELDTKLQHERLDVSLPTRAHEQGGVHPITQTTDEIIAILGAMGFVLAEGPEIEEDALNFTALNMPPSHPARQMHDTFYVHGTDAHGAPKLLRTHTSPVQIRAMLDGKPPYRIMAPGRTYRCDHDITHTPMFHQVEGLCIGTDVHFGHLKGCLQNF